MDSAEALREGIFEALRAYASTRTALLLLTSGHRAGALRKLGGAERLEHLAAMAATAEQQLVDGVRGIRQTLLRVGISERRFELRGLEDLVDVVLETSLPVEELPSLIAEVAMAALSGIPMQLAYYIPEGWVRTPVLTVNESTRRIEMRGRAPDAAHNDGRCSRRRTSPQ
jgi:hypothetical protein